MTTQSLRLIQTGDWHLFANCSTWAPSGFQSREARLKQCIQEIFTASHDTDFLILTGDLIERHRQADDKSLAWLDRELTSLGKDKVVVTYGSHDHPSVRDWFSSRAAPRKRLSANVYTIEPPSCDLIFYAVDSGFKDSRDQSLKMRDAVETILKARKDDHRRAVLVTQLKERDKRLIQRLQGCINYAALGDHHFCRLLTGMRPCAAYSGAPVARDACTDGDSGSRWFVEVAVKLSGQAVPIKIPLPTGGCQVKVKAGPEALLVINGPNEPGSKNKHAMEIKKLQNMPKQIVDKINEITKNKWTSIALADSVPRQKDILGYIEQRYRDSTKSFFSTTTRNGAMYYFVRSERKEGR
jgi:DNA repair exonuclease SbcCD nuclease subunit